MRGPPDAEVLATGGQLTDEFGQAAVVGVATSRGAEQGDRVVRVGGPVAPEVARVRVEEQEPRLVRWTDRVGVDGGVESLTELVRRQQVKPAVDERTPGSGALS